MVGGGVFSLPHDLAVGANSGATIIGRCITAMGMIPATCARISNVSKTKTGA